MRVEFSYSLPQWLNIVFVLPARGGFTVANSQSGSFAPGRKIIDPRKECGFRKAAVLRFAKLKSTKATQ
jgi:hypothetical protein